MNDVITEQYQLLYGDCLLRMQEIPDASIDMILCDLPYGTTACKWDSIIPFEPLWEQYKRVIKPNAAIVLFGREPFSSFLRCSNLGMYKYDWIWEKSNATGFLNAKKRPLSAFENVSVFYKKQPTYNAIMSEGHERKVSSAKNRRDSAERFNAGDRLYGEQKLSSIKGYDSTTRYPRSVLKFPKDTQKTSLHPTQKPVALLEYLIRTYSKEGETILDNTMGSCSTGVSCLNTNRKFIGVESNEGYFEISCKRMEEKC